MPQSINYFSFISDDALNHIKKNVELAFWKSLIVPPTQPLQVLIRAQQSAPGILGVLAALKQVTRPQPNAVNPESFFARVKPLFNGGAVGGVKEGTKNLFYKGTVIQGAPSLVDKLLYSVGFPVYCSPLTYHLTQSILAGIFAGAMDTLIGGGLESWATFLATSTGKDSGAKFWSEVSAQQSLAAKIGRIYKGSAVAAGKSSVAFGTNFIARSPVQSWVESMYQLDDTQKLPWHGNILSAVMTGGLVAATSSPLDIAKTLAQKPNPDNAPVLTLLKRIIAEQGFRKLTAGVPLKFLMVTLGWGITNWVIPSKEHAGKGLSVKEPASKVRVIENTNHDVKELKESLPSEEENQSGPSFRP